LNTMAFHSVDLLDIAQIIPLNWVDRELYPFAKISCSFVIRVYDKDMLFEAENTSQRDWFIDALKILVATLWSKIIVGDRDVLNEFFTATGYAVPGEAPAIFRD